MHAFSVMENIIADGPPKSFARERQDRRSHRPDCSGRTGGSSWGMPIPCSAAPVGALKSIARYIDIIRQTEGVHCLSTLSALILSSGTFFNLRFACHPRSDHRGDRRDFPAGRGRSAGFRPEAQGGAAVAFPISALTTHPPPSRCGWRTDLRDRCPISSDGEMNADAAIARTSRFGAFPPHAYRASHNLLIMPNCRCRPYRL